MRILADVDDEDAARGTGSSPLRRSYLATSVFELMRSRIGWLLILIIAATLTVNVLDYFEDTLAQVVTLALFVPLLIGTGGNAGSQSATMVVRAMAVGDIRTRDLGRVVRREVATGLLLGLTLAVFGLLPAAWFAGWSIAFVVGLSLVTICVLATGVRTLIRIAARRAARQHGSETRAHPAQCSRFCHDDGEAVLISQGRDRDRCGSGGAAVREACA